MTDSQFDAIATLLQLRQGPAQEAARLVLVGGLRQIDAAALMGISAASVNNTVQRVRRGMDLARAAVSNLAANNHCNQSLVG